MLLTPVEILSCSMTSQPSQTVLRWVNRTFCDFIEVRRNGESFATLASDETRIIMGVHFPGTETFEIIGCRDDLVSHPAMRVQRTPDCVPQFVELQNSATGPYPVRLRGGGMDRARVAFTVTEIAPFGLRIEVFSGRLGAGELKASIVATDTGEYLDQGISLTVPSGIHAGGAPAHAYPRCHSDVSLFR